MDRADSEAVHIFDALENNCAYDIYAVAEDGYGELQPVAAVVKATTLDGQAPAWISGYPAALPSYYSIRVNLNADKTSSAYLLCLNSGAASPMAAQVKAGTDASGNAVSDKMKGRLELSPGTASGFEFTQLSSGMRYDIYVIAENRNQVFQAEVTKLSATTLQYIVYPPTLYGGSASKDSLYTMDVNTDGYIDHIVVRFSKAMRNSSITQAGFTVAGYTVAAVTTDADGIVDDPGSDGDLADSQYVIIRINEKTESSRDTGATPAVTIASNNIVATDGTFFTGLSATASFDKALTLVDPETATAIDSFTITMNKTVNSESATAYFVCLPDGASAPSTAQIKAGTDADGNLLAATLRGSATLSPDQNGVLTASGLVSATTYNVYIIVEDAASNIKTMNKLEITTD